MVYARNELVLSKIERVLSNEQEPQEQEENDEQISIDNWAT